MTAAPIPVQADLCQVSKGKRAPACFKTWPQELRTKKLPRKGAANTEKLRSGAPAPSSSNSPKFVGRDALASQECLVKFSRTPACMDQAWCLSRHICGRCPQRRQPKISLRFKATELCAIRRAKLVAQGTYRASAQKYPRERANLIHEATSVATPGMSKWHSTRNGAWQWRSHRREVKAPAPSWPLNHTH